MQLYIKGKGIKLQVKNHIPMAPGIFLELAKKGYVVLDLYNGAVRYEDGSLNQYVPAHSMLITGVTADCRYIVSTWGQKLYVNPNEVMGKDGKPARFDYQYYEFG